MKNKFLEKKKAKEFKFSTDINIPNGVYKYYETTIGKEVSQFLNEKRHRLNDNEISYRVINHWEKMDLISVKRDSKKGWRKYSIIDLVWIKIIAALRRLGYPIETISKVKENLEKYEHENKITQFPFLEFYVTLTLFFDEQVYLLVFPDGEAKLLDWIELLLIYESLGDHIAISIDDILKKIYPQLKKHPDYKFHFMLSEEEMKTILKYIKDQENL